MSEPAIYFTTAKTCRCGDDGGSLDCHFLACPARCRVNLDRCAMRRGHDGWCRSVAERIQEGPLP